VIGIWLKRGWRGKSAMKNDNWEQVERLFHETLDLKSEDRMDYLKSACPEDEIVRQEVKSLIYAFENCSELMQEPVFSLGMKVLGGNFVEGTLEGKQIGTYKIVKLIGKGGMGEVYLAEDAFLDRKIALKFISNKFVDDRWARRQLIKEAQAIAKLDHTNICAVYGFEEDEEHSFMVMQYIEGDTLASFIDKKCLEVKEAVDFAIQMTNALAEAHSHYIVHRDIKPQNIIVTANEQIKVLDFGLAEIIRQKQRPSGIDTHQSQISQQGLIIGTVSYMSPEQLRAEKLDFRSDIFSFGIVFFEMLTGQNPFSRQSQAETISAILNNEAPPLSDIITDIPDALNRIVRKCLSKDKEKRYQSAVEVLMELNNFKNGVNIKSAPSRRFVGIHNYAVLIFFLLLAFGVTLILYSSSTARVQTFAILPIANESNNAGNDYLSDGLTGSLINKLSRLSTLKVKPLPVVSQYKRKAVNPQTAGQELGVETVLVGKIVQQGNVRVLQASLVNTETGMAVWSEDYIIEDTKLLSVQEKISSRIISQLGPLSSEDERKLEAASQTSDPEAFKAYLQGQTYWSQRDEQRENIEKAIEQFTKATEIDPNYAQAWAGRADSYILNVITYDGKLSNEESIAMARLSANRAIEIDVSLCQPYTSLGVIKLRYDWDWRGAEDNFKTAISLNPEYAPAHYWYSSLLRLQKRYDEALAEGRKAKEFDPSSLSMDINIGRVFYYQRNFERTIQFYTELLEKNPGNKSIEYILGFVYLQTGKIKEATDIFEKMYAFDRRRAAAGLGYAYGKAGRTSEALRILNELEEIAKQKDVPPQEKAWIYLGLGDKDRVFEYLDKSCAAHNASFPDLIMLDPILEELRSDSRFARLIACVYP
jgi:eukaryotic-like serine/threonine-protein kinase